MPWAATASIQMHTQAPVLSAGGRLWPVS